MPASSVFFTFVISVHDPFYGKTRIIRVRYPGPRICRTFAQNCAAVSSQGLPEIRSPLGATPERSGHGAGGLRRSQAGGGALAAVCLGPKADWAARTSSRRSAKADNDGRLCPGGAFSAARPAGTARFLITREKASFYETATFGRRKVFFCSPFCGLLFCPTRAKLALPAGEKPAAPKPRPPRGGPPNDRDRLPVFAPPARTPAPATPPQSACSRRLSGCPQRPNLSARRRAESPKGKRKGGTPDETRTAALTTAPPEDGWEGSQPKRAQRRGKPAKQPRRSAS